MITTKQLVLGCARFSGKYGVNFSIAAPNATSLELLIFQDENERLSIISSIKYVNKAIISIDKDKTQISTIKYIHNKYNK